MGAGVRRIVPLTLGWEDLPKSVSVEGASDQEQLREPVPGVLLECDGGWLLLDTGFNAALITDPALRRRFHGDPAIQPVLPGPGEPLDEALARVGVDIADIYAVAVSHLHNDHAGGCRCTSSGPNWTMGSPARPARRTTASSGWISTTRGSTGARPRVTRRSRRGSPRSSRPGTRLAIRVSWSAWTARSAAEVSCS